MVTIQKLAGLRTCQMHDVEKLERVRKALAEGDIKSAALEAKVYELTPIIIE